MVRPQPRFSWWEVIGIELLDIRHLPVDVWQQFSNLIELRSCTISPPSFSYPSLSLSLLFYTKIHESLASGVAVGWIKVLWLPLLWVRGPSVQLNISEWRDHSLKVTHSRATQSGIDGRDFQLCAWEMFPAICSCDVFYFSVSRFQLHTSHSRGEENRGKHSPRSSPPLYVQLQDLLTLFNYGAFLKTAFAVGKCCHWKGVSSLVIFFLNLSLSTVYCKFT